MVKLYKKLFLNNFATWFFFFLFSTEVTSELPPPCPTQKYISNLHPPGVHSHAHARAVYPLARFTLYNTFVVRCVCVVVYNDLIMWRWWSATTAAVYYYYYYNVRSTRSNPYGDRSHFPNAMDGVIYACAHTVEIQKTCR